MPTSAAFQPPANPIVGHRVELQLLTTLKCNLKCSYCSLGVGDVLGSQTQVEYDIDELAAFADRHLAGKEVVVTFYGGEPTLNRPMMVGASTSATSRTTSATAATSSSRSASCCASSAARSTVTTRRPGSRSCRWPRAGGSPTARSTSTSR